MPRPKLTPEQKSYIDQHYSNMSAAQIATHLGVNAGRIFSYAYQIGLFKSEAYTAQKKQQQADRLCKLGAASRFKKGHSSYNKGKPMSTQKYNKCKFTMFKPGQQPHNTKYNGHERICSKDGYILIRVATGKYVHKHRHIYEQHHGPIPPGIAIAFKDGNKTDCHIDNLEAITRQQLAQRNTITRYPPELRSAMHALKKLNKALNTQPQPQTQTQPAHEKQN